MWDVMGMYFIVFGVTIMFELIVHKVDHTITSDSGHKIFHHVTQEIMILGGISAVLVMFENLGGSKIIDAPLFHFVHFAVFVMAVIFIIFISTLFITVEGAWRKYIRFEHKVNEIENDPSLTFDSKAAFLQQHISRVKDGQRKLASLIFFRQNLPGPFADSSFQRYMQKKQRRFLTGFLELHGSSWFLLAVLCTLAATVTYITLQVSDNELATIGLWVLFVGFGPLLVLIVVFFKIKKEFFKFTNEVMEMRMNGNLKLEKPQRSYFWRGNPALMTKVMQTMLLYQVFFVATASINFVYRLLQVKPYGVLLILACFIPSCFVFFFMIPLVLPRFTILASLGDLLDHDTLLSMKQADRKSGKYRRQVQRDAKITVPAQFLAQSDHVVQKFGVSEEDEDFDSMMDPLMKKEKKQITGLCEECEEREAVTECGQCKMLFCEECDFSYHKLRGLRKHIRSAYKKKRRGSLGEFDFESSVGETSKPDGSLNSPKSPVESMFKSMFSNFGNSPVTSYRNPLPQRTLPPMPAAPKSKSSSSSADRVSLVSFGRGSSSDNPMLPPLPTQPTATTSGLGRGKFPQRSRHGGYSKLTDLDV
eukprot:TRINITY_DN18584_c0_g1_i2.p1 TRINITY_DN18584_c0_g1~~TRINITY_DN18584_c0_g1_i2.p1  ORF type:complete len:661 (+),score=98.91 TRINITY_DN18584_c0_g1_i2:214-1983(+)